MSKARDLANVGSGKANLQVASATAVASNPSVFTRITDGLIEVQAYDYIEGSLQTWSGQPTGQGLMAYVGGDGSIWASNGFWTSAGIHASTGQVTTDFAAGGTIYADTVSATNMTVNSKPVAAATLNMKSYGIGDAYTLVLADGANSVEMDRATANTVTVPPFADVQFPIGTQILISQYGAGQTTIAAGTGVTIRSNGGKFKLNGQYAQATLVKRGNNEWYLSGNLVA